MIPWLYFLQDDEQLLIEGFTRRFTVEGPSVYLSLPLYRVQRRRGMTLGPTEYLRVRDRLTGELRNELGPKMYFQKANDEVLKRFAAIALKHNQFVVIIDKSTGILRVARGETLVYLSPHEEQIDGVREGINVDEHTAVLIRDTGTGSQQLLTEQQVFVPGPKQEIMEVQKRILLEDHETVVIKDKTGKFLFRKGHDKERSFFLDPYCGLLKFQWSSGIHKEQRNLIVTHIDMRPKFMWYEFGARTQDNVELNIGITFFWQISDVEKMVRTTDDVPGDICSHARSQIIQSVSQVTLERFLADFNAIVAGASLHSEDPFYPDRGVLLHAVEVRSITCKDEATQKILQEIIQETTNRLNMIQKQETSNEVMLKEISGKIEAEKVKGELLEIQHDHVLREFKTKGEAEAERVRVFLEGVGKDVPAADRIGLFNTLRKKEILEKLSEGKAQLFFTPSDVDLSIESKDRSLG
ncbi:MAG: SPFH domain-containing protein [Candidatus Wallbacteria bacterium]|nr:SPFH domain-containing protein [Candidatus Wallbacteria bacterium]